MTTELPLVDRSKPLPAEWTVQRGLEAYFAENGFSRAVYDAPRSPAAFWGFSYSIPNPPRHRWGLMWHDLHHVATGFGTDVAGEGEICAWEVRSLRYMGVYVGFLVMLAVGWGLLGSPLRTLRSFRRAAGGRTLLDGALQYESALNMTIGQLREHLRLDQAGLARAPRRLHSLAPRPAATVTEHASR